MQRTATLLTGLGLTLLLAASPFAGSAPVPAVTHVDINLYLYISPVATIPSGGTIVWDNIEVIPINNHHTVTHTLGEWDSGHLVPGHQWSRTFHEPAGTVIPYYCFIHPFMHAVVVVT